MRRLYDYPPSINEFEDQVNKFRKRKGGI